MDSDPEQDQTDLAIKPTQAMDPSDYYAYASFRMHTLLAGSISVGNSAGALHQSLKDRGLPVIWSLISSCEESPLLLMHSCTLYIGTDGETS